MPVGTTPRYTDRPQLSAELSRKLSKEPGRSLAHSVTVVGLGGAKETQLVLNYIQTHEDEYNTIFWIDARSEETVRLSYQRCCRGFGLSVEATFPAGPLQDTSAVHAVMSRLRKSKDGANSWLAVVDNADDLSWSVGDIVPNGEAGTVIITSRNSQVSQLTTGMVKVDVMERQEAIEFMSGFFSEGVERTESCQLLLEDIANRLGRLPLAIHLAESRILADMQDNADDLETALRQYLADHQSHQDQLLRDEGYVSASSSAKTVWTVWDTSLSSLKKDEERTPGVCATNLPTFLTLFDRSNVQDELF